MQNITLEKTQKRIHWIDICRGIAIILVLYGHTFVSDKYSYLIFAFHMPLFFFISGLVFKQTSKPFTSIISKYFKQLLIPYYIFALLTYVFALVSQTTDFSLKGIGWQLFGILYGSGSDGMLGYNVVLWFIPCLFITKLSFAVLTKRVSQSKLIFLFLFASASIGALISNFAPWMKLPFGFEIALTGFSFFGIGYLIKKHKYNLSTFITHKWLISITALLFTILVATVNYKMSGVKVDLRINQLNNIPLFYLGAMSGIILWTTISQLIVKNAFLEYIGRHSMVLFAWHNVLYTDMQNLISTILDQGLLDTIKFVMPTLYVITAMSIILFGRMVIMKLKGAYTALL